MSGIKRHLEDISVELGYGGEINEEVEAEAERRMLKEEVEQSLVLWAQHCVQAGRRVPPSPCGGIENPESDDYLIINGTFDELVSMAKTYAARRGIFGWRVAGEIRQFAYEKYDREPYELAYWRKTPEGRNHWARIPMGVECSSFDTNELEDIAIALWEIDPFRRSRFAIISYGDWNSAEEIER